jgi:CHASE2 domain-containing sensor protein
MEKQKVVVTDIQMSFGSMVVFMVKWAIAVIPAAIILGVVGIIFASLFAGITAGL